MSKEKPKPAVIRVEVPPELGEIYDGEKERQWVERRHRISGATLKACEGTLGKLINDEQAFEALCVAMSDVLVDWTLEGDDGPLPKPWQNPAAFRALYESDYEVLGWVWNLTFMSVAELLASKN